MKQIRKKLLSDSGFTLTETLMAILIMSIIFTAVGGGVVVMKNNYEKVTQKAQAQVLLATCVSAINTDLESATSVKMSGEGEQVGAFYSSYRNTWVKYESKKADETKDNSRTTIYLTFVNAVPSEAAASGGETDFSQKIVTDKARTEHLSVMLSGEDEEDEEDAPLIFHPQQVVSESTASDSGDGTEGSGMTEGSGSFSTRQTESAGVSGYFKYTIQVKALKNGKEEVLEEKTIKIRPLSPVTLR